MYVHLHLKMQGGSKLMSMPFETFRVLYGFGTFSKTCTAAYSQLYK